MSVGFSTPLGAQDLPLDQLFEELRDADPETFARIESRITAELEKSGSASMDLLLRRGQDAMQDGMPDAAVEHFSALVDHAPAFASGYLGRASAYFVLGLIGPALDDLAMTLTLEPRHLDAIRGLASIMEEQERPADALSLYQMILDINPQSTDAQEQVARLKLQLEGQAI